MSPPPVSRRTMLGGTLAAAVTAATLAGCGTESPSSEPETGGYRELLPTRRGLEQLTPDLPSDESGLMAGYLSYPSELVNVVDEPPGRGGTVTALCQYNNNGLPPSLEKNQLWQGLNERIGAELEFIGTPAGEYQAKFSTVVAGGDLPDLVQVRPDRTAQLPSLLEAKFADLTPHLAGDAVLNYPVLASHDTAMWEQCIYNGRLYGIPVARGRVGSLMVIRQDLADTLGLTSDPADADDFFALAQELTDERSNRWAIATLDSGHGFVREMFGVPNEWRVDDGGFTSWYETDEERAAIEYSAKLWQAGVCHPDGFGSAQAPAWFTTDTPAAAMSYGGYGFWSARYIAAGDTVPEMHVSGVAAPKADGGGLASKHLSGGIYSITAIPQADEDRVAELLGIVNYLAAPIGTAESLAIDYGIEGHDFERESGEPVLTSTGTEERKIPTEYVAGSNPTLYVPGHPDAVTEQHEFQQRVLADSVANPAQGLYSETAQSKRAQLQTVIDDVRNEIIQGRKSMADWDAAVAEWRAGGGDQMRSEYEAAWQERH